MEQTKIQVEQLSFYYGLQRALSNVSMSIPANRVTGLIGPSGCGKSTFLRCLNRMNDIIPNTRVEGVVRLDGENVYDRSMDVVKLPRRHGVPEVKPVPEEHF
jgi:phosphate transport system ATP-binding protein